MTAPASRCVEHVRAFGCVVGKPMVSVVETLLGAARVIPVLLECVINLSGFGSRRKMIIPWRLRWRRSKIITEMQLVINELLADALRETLQPHDS